MNRKWAIAVLVVTILLLALYVASLGVGTRDSRGKGPALQPDLNAPWVQRLRSRLTQRLKGEDLRVSPGSDPGCELGADQLAVPVEASCEWGIAANDRTTRALRVRLVQGTAVTLTLAQDGYLTIEDEPLVAGEAAKVFDVYRNQADARLTLNACEVDEEAAEELCRVSLR